MDDTAQKGEFCVLKDEKSNWSSARVFILVWTAFSGLAVFVNPPPEFWGTASAVLIGLISWAAGPRIAQYIGGQIGAAASAVAGRIKGADNDKTGNTNNAVGNGGGSFRGSGGGNITA